MDKKIIVFFLIIVASVLLVRIYISSPELQKQVALYTEEDFSEDNIYSDLKSLSIRLDEEILKGSESFVVYLKDMDIDSINKINESLNGIFGNGETYQQIGAVGNTYKKVSITIKHSINYYAMQAYLHQTPIPESEPRAKELYQVMKSILDTKITDNMTDYEKELALHDYLVTNCKYSNDTSQPAGSDIYLAYGALVNQEAVCNGYAEALQLLFVCAGIRSRFVIGEANGISHAWNLVELDGNWYHLDATWNDPLPDKGSELIHPYFNVPDDVIEMDHEWKKEDYPKADCMEYNYYMKNETCFSGFEDYQKQAYDFMVQYGNDRYEAMIENYEPIEEDMQFIFENNYRYNTVNWQNFQVGNYCVLVLKAE